MNIKAPESPIVSVVLSVYNGGRYLSEAIESIVNQDFLEFEFIIINDGSSDQTKSVINRFKDLDPRIISIERENRGLVYSLNEGVALSKGEYIVRMDADDIAHPNRIKEQVEFMRQNPDVGVCGSWIEVFSENSIINIKKHPVLHDDLAPIILFTSPVAHPSTIIRRCVLVAAPYNNKFPHAEDYKLWSELIFNTKFSTIGRPLLKYRTHDLNTSKVAENFNKKERFNVACEIFKSVLKRLKIENTEKEMEIHFSISLNARSVDANHGVFAVNKYIKKIYRANKLTQIFSDEALRRVLIKRFLVYIYFSFKIGKIDAIYCICCFNFWYGIFLLLTRKLL